MCVVVFWFVCCFFFFFFKQKTAYEMRISDWSSDVCSSDLYGSGAALVLYGRHLLVREGSSNWSPTAAILFGCGLIAAALATDWFSWRAQGIDPEVTAQGAFSHAMLALQGQLVAVVLLMGRSEEHTSELQSLMRISYAVFC